MQATMPRTKVRADQLEAHEPLASADRYGRRLDNFLHMHGSFPRAQGDSFPPNLAAHTDCVERIQS